MNIKSFAFRIETFCVFIICFTHQLNGQSTQPKTGDVGDEQVTVVKAYQPTLSDAIKITDVPQKDTAQFIAPDLNYVVDAKKLDTKYNITPIKPVKIKDENIKKLYRAFIKAGYGNYNTPYGEVFFNAMRSKQFDAGVHFKHLSATGSIKGFGFPGYSENNLELFGKKFFENSVLAAEINYDRDVVHYYGYLDPPEIFSKSETLHRMGIFSGDFSLASSHNHTDMLDYKVGINFYNYTDNKDQSETDFNINGMLGKHLSNNNYFKADISFDIGQTEFPPGINGNQGGFNAVSVNRFILKVNPRYEFIKDGMIISAGGNVAIENAYDESHYHLYPFVHIKYPLIKEEFSVFGQLNGELKKNSVYSLNEENPFIRPSPVESANILVNSNNKFDVRGGIEVKPDREFQVIAYASFSRILNDVFYENTLNTTGITYYRPAYYDNSQLNLHAEAQYMHDEKFGIHLKTDYFSYNLPDDTQPWFKPAFMITLGGNYTIQDKIFVKAELFYNGTSKAVSIDGKGTELKSYIDLNFGVDYRYSKLLSIFVQINNLTASRYFKWYNYPSYRLNAMGGITLSF